MRNNFFTRSGALALLLFLSFFVSACAEEQASVPTDEKAGDAQEQPEPDDSWTTVQSVNPEDILSEEERTGVPKYRDWNEKSPEGEIQLPFGTSAGAIPAVKPFNFGRDPGGPEDKTLYLTIPKLGLDEVPAFDSISDAKLEEGTIHIPATGFPWQNGANVYIAGHRLGYPDTRSFYVFYDLDKLAVGDEVSLKDAAGDEYTYRVTEQRVVPPDNIEVMNAVEGRSIITLQTCTLPDYAERIIVQGELVEKPA